VSDPRPSGPGRRCPDDDLVLAHAEGRLEGDAQRAVLAHLADCDDCAALVGHLAGSRAEPTWADGALALPLTVGHYQLTAMVGIGGMGRVYRARDLQLGRDVAIKVPRGDRPSLRRRFEREIAITAHLQHPGVVAIHASGTLPDGAPFYVMPFVDGRTLDAVVATAPAAQRPRLLAIVTAVATTMGDVHARGIAHRDLKPNNILVTDLGHPMVLDWGLAKDGDGRAGHAGDARGSDLGHSPVASPDIVTGFGDVLGTPAFMAPEQAAGAATDVRADVFALGRILAFVATGSLAGHDRAALVAAAVPGHVVDVIMRATAIDPAARYADGRAMARALDDALARSARATPARRRRRWTVIAAAVAVAGLSAAGTIAVVRGRSGPTSSATVTIAVVRRGAAPLNTRAVALAPSGRRIAFDAQSRIEIHDLIDGRTWIPPGTGTWPGVLDFESDDRLVYTRHVTETSIERVAFDLRTGVTEVLAPPGADRPMGRVGVGRHGTLYTSSGSDRLVLDGPGGLSPVATGNPGAFLRVAVSPDGDRIAYVDADAAGRGHLVVVALTDAGRAGPDVVGPEVEGVTAMAWTGDHQLLLAGAPRPQVMTRFAVDGSRMTALPPWHVAIDGDADVTALVAGGGRVFAVASTSTFETRRFDPATGAERRLDPVAASAPLAWTDAGDLLVWNASTLRVEALDRAGAARLTDVVVEGNPASATRAGDTLIVVTRGAGGRDVQAYGLTTGARRWRAPIGALAFVRCAGDVAPPCVAGVRDPADDLVTLRSIDPATGALAPAVLARGAIDDAAIDRAGRALTWLRSHRLIERRPLTVSAGADVELVASVRWAHALTVTDDGVALVAGVNDGDRVVMAFDRAPPRTLLVSDAAVLGLLRLRPDGHELAVRGRWFVPALLELEVPR